MQQYWVEGLYITRQGVNKSKKSGKTTDSDIEPFAQTIWATNQEDAIRMAGEEIGGGRWVEGPTVSGISEEQRMRNQGAPELPGLGGSRKKQKPRK